ncbi:MAG: GGDEF domain-containing protein [Bdellovibrionaceae bacterium]|nr:GGDEF domain-containing protein [Pseudobdellovibrionaceae bacterium]
MSLRELAQKFTVFVFHHDLDKGASLKVAFSGAGYDAWLIHSYEGLNERLLENPPHILVADVTNVPVALADFVGNVLQKLPEIRFVLLVRPDLLPRLSDTNDLGIEEVLPCNQPGLEKLVLRAVDRTAEKLALIFQNERLAAELRQLREEKSELSDRLKVASPIEVSQRLLSYRSATSRDELLQRMLSELPEGSEAAWFRFLPETKSFVFTHGCGRSLSGGEGLGVSITTGELKDFYKQLSLGFVPPGLNELVRSRFGYTQGRLLPLFFEEQLEGVLVFDLAMNAALKHRLQEEFSLAATAFQVLALEGKMRSLEVRDSTTGLYNRQFYEKRLREEVARARRTLKPVSVIKIALDDYLEITSALGEAVRDLLIKKLAHLLESSSRVTDINCRIDENEIAVILPVTPRDGAMLRAERLRRDMEATQLLENGIKVSISLGISEYPSLCRDETELDETSRKALLHIYERGGNRICSYRAPEGYQPEFSVTPELR